MRSTIVAIAFFVVVGSSLVGIAADAPPVISAKELNQLQSDVTWVNRQLLLDTRTKEQYEAGHIVGAKHLDVALIKKAAASDTALQDAKAWGKLLTDMGIERDKVVIVYGDPLPDAARVWWLLSYAGVKARLLDGGFKAWVGNDGPISKEGIALSPASSPFEVVFQKDRLATASELKLIGVEQKACQIVDNRTEAEYTGKEVRGARGGHIPSSISLDWTQFVDSEGKLLPPNELKKRIESSGIDLEKPIATHCQSGGRSSVGALVFELVSGKPAKNYYGSWADWSSKSDLPVE